MSVSPVVALPNLHFPLTPQEETPTPASQSLTQSQVAALRYLSNRNDDEIVRDALDHLTAICWKACRGLFIPDGYREYKVTGDDYYETDNTETTRLRNFISEWLFTYFEPYNDASPEVVQSSAEGFRHIGRRCRNALLNVIRKCQVCGKRKVKQCLKCERLLTHREMNKKHDTCPQCSALLKGNVRLVCKNECDPLSVRTSLDVCYLDDDEQGAGLGEYLTVVAPPSLLSWLAESKSDLESLKIYEGCRAFITAFAEGGIRDVTGAWCEQQSICDKTARRRREKFLARIRELKAHPLVREFYRLIEANSDGPQVVLAVEESTDTREARKAKSAAARQLAEFHKTLSPEGRVESERAANEFLATESSKNSDEVNSRRNPEIASATFFVKSGSGFDSIQKVEAEALMTEVSEDDLAHALGLESADDLSGMSSEEIAETLYPTEPTYYEDSESE